MVRHSKQFNAKKRARTVAKRIALQKRRFLLEMENTCGVMEASCKRVGVTRATIYNWRDKDPAFAEQWAEAVARGWGEFKATGVERAMEKSDTLWLRIAEAHWPKEFRQRLELDLRHDPELIALASAMIEVLREFCPRDQFRAAFARLGSMTGLAVQDKQIEDATVVANGNGNSR